MANPFKSFFLFCSGASGAILKTSGCEVEHNKYAGIGATIFFTAVLAALSGGYAMFTVFRDATLALAFGLLWGLIIFNLDRFIVSSIRKTKVGANLPLGRRAALKAGEILKALPRLILAVFISIVITRPIELRLFESEIQGQIAKDLTHERTQVEQDINVEYADIGRLRVETEGLRNRLVELQNEVTRRVSVATSELEGWGGTKRPGEGPEYKKRQDEVRKAEAELNAFRTQYGPVIQGNEVRIKQREKERDDKTAAAKGTIDQSPGLMKQLGALSTLMGESTTVLLASLFIILLFISLETAPILVKLFSSRGPYDDYLDAAEHTVYATQQKNISEINDEVNTSVALGKLINAGRLQAELQLFQSTMASLHTLAPQEFQDAQLEIARKAIARWKASQLNQLNYSPTLTTYPAPPPTTAPRSAPPTGAAAPPPNVSTPPAPPGAATPAGASAAPAPAGSPSINGGGVHAGVAAPAQPWAQQPVPQKVVPLAPPPAAQPPAAATTGQGASSTAQQSPPNTGPQNGPGAPPPPQGSGGNGSNP